MIWLFFVGLLFVLLFVGMYVQSYRYTIQRVPLYFSNLPATLQNTTIVFISDIHRRKISKHTIHTLAKQKIDFVCIGGDLTEKGVDPEITEENVRLLTTLGHTYFVWGNHDIQAGAKILTSLLESYGVQILNNRAVVTMEKQNERLWLVGVGDICSNNDKLDTAIQSITENNGFRILLCHVPTIAYKITPKHQISLVLSGHTHGGQIALPWIGAITGGVGKWFPKHVVGHHHINDVQLFISSGYGTSHMPLRLFTTPEIVLLTLKREKDISTSPSFER